MDEDLPVDEEYAKQQAELASRPPNLPMQDKKLFQVAVFYPKGWEKYGGIHTFATINEARKERDTLLSLGPDRENGIADGRFVVRVVRAPA